MKFKVGLMLGLIMLIPLTLLAQVTGHWEGSFVAGGRTIPMSLDLRQGEAETLGTISLPKCGFSDFPIPEIKATSTKLTLAIPAGWGLAMFRAIGLSPGQQTVEYEGTLQGDEIRGEIRLAGQGFPLLLRRGEPQQAPYKTEEVRFTNGDISLSGTLLLPSGFPRPPLIIFVHGSGDRTRNGHRYEADLVARHGIAALIYDKRGAGKSTGANWEVATLQELASDANAAVEFGSKRPDIDRTRIGMYGISQGTWIIAMVAAHSPDVSFLISVSGSGIPVWEQDMYRTESMMKAEGYSDADTRDALTLMKQKFDVGRTGLWWEQLDKRLKGLREGKVTWFPSYTGDATSLASPRFWWIAFFSYDPAPDLGCVHARVLTILGGRDLSFPSERVAQTMKRYLPATVGNFTRIIPTAEHSMLSPVSVDGRTLFQSVDPQYMGTMLDWLDRVVVRGRRLPKKGRSPCHCSLRAGTTRD